MGILVKNGLIIDGTGRSGYKSDMLIKGDRIEKIENNLDADGFEVIDASNKVVAPGFIDIHNHSVEEKGTFENGLSFL
ncbi:MAG: hypothetical protein ACTSRI_12850 [Promethearchaeota archaeon]